MISTLQPGVQQGGQQRSRRSGRLLVSKNVQISGVNVEGRDFAAPATTLVLSRHGALVVMKQGLVPDQEIGVFNPDNAKDETARIVSMLGKDAGGYLYGVEFQDPGVDFWNISFPSVHSYRPAAQVAAVEAIPDSAPARLEKSAGESLPPLAPLLIAEVRPSSLVSPARRASHDYSILLKCPYDSQDEWVLLRDRSEGLQEILATRWPFDCPIHGVQMEFPVIANEGAIEQTPAPARLSSEKFAGLEAFHAASRGASATRLQTRYTEARRVWVRGVDALGNPFSQSTYSVNISRNGARLQGLGFLAGPGVQVELRRNWKKAFYQVVWMGQHGTSLASQVGVMCLQPDKNVWGLS